MLVFCLTAKPMSFVSSGQGRVTQGIRKGVQRDRGTQGGGRGKVDLMTRPCVPHPHHPCDCSAPLLTTFLASSTLATRPCHDPKLIPTSSLCICCALCLTCPPLISTPLAPSGLCSASPFIEAFPDHPLHSLSPHPTLVLFIALTITSVIFYGHVSLCYSLSSLLDH